MIDSEELRLSPDDLKEIGVTEDVTLEMIVANMIKKGNNARSPVLGSAGEVHFRVNMHRSGAAIIDKIDDQVFHKRYDFEVLFEDGELYTYENKIATGKGKKRGTVRVGFGDSRDVELPSGLIWKTHARHISESFDFLSILMVRFSKDWRDFLFYPFEKIPHIKASDKSLKEYEKRDRDWIEENYLQLSISVPLCRGGDFSSLPRP